MKTRYKRSSKKKYIIIAITVVLLMGILLVIAELANVTNLYSRSPRPASQSDEVNYGPPTEQESKAGDEQKQNIPTQSDNNEPTTPPNVANVAITGVEQNGDTIEVTASISNVYKDGTCAIKLEQGSNVVTKSTSAYRDVSTTICTNPLIPRSEFPVAGDWKVTVSYTSYDGVFGQSEPKTVRVD